MTRTYFGLGSNSNGLVAGTPANAVMRRMKTAALLGDVLIQDGIYEVHAGPGGGFADYQFSVAPDAQWQTASERGSAQRGGFTVELGNQGVLPTQSYDLVTFTFGGDDIDFPEVMKQCVGIVGVNDPNYVQPDPGNGHYCPADGALRQRIQDDLAGTYIAFLTKVAEQAVNPRVGWPGGAIPPGHPTLVHHHTPGW